VASHSICRGTCIFLKDPVMALNIHTIEWYGTKSHSMRDVKITILGTDNSITIPCEVNTKVYHIKGMICPKLGLEPEKFSFITKHASSFKKLQDWDEIPSHVTVKGFKSWDREKAKYPHPICIIGAGHNGLRQAMSFLKEDILDFVVYDRFDIVGGTAWVKNANPTSKLQTEYGVYHLQYDAAHDLPKGMSTWPPRDELLKHFHDVSIELGIMPHVQLQTEVTETSVIINSKEAPFFDPKKQHYNVVLMRLDGKNKEDEELSYSGIAMYPGALIAPLRMDFKGEDVFDGQIGYGMFSEFDYTLVRGQQPAVIGMGAFAVENVRTCLENSAKKVFLVCRRKNIAMPRCVSWWINQSLFPPTAVMMMEFMKPMYDMIPDDPWTYYAVNSNKDRTTCTIRQKSRFGIGDIYFLAAYYEKCVMVVDQVKRLKPRQILLEGGDKLDADALVKVLGFRPDETVDKVLGIKEMVGYFANGDHRRWVCTEFPGVDAGKFGGTSFSPGAIQNVEFVSWFFNYPKDLAPVFDGQVLPRKKAVKIAGILHMYGILEQARV